MYLTLWLLDHFVAGLYSVGASAALIISTSMAALLLIALSALKRRFATI